MKQELTRFGFMETVGDIDFNRISETINMVNVNTERDCLASEASELILKHHERYMRQMEEVGVCAASAEQLREELVLAEQDLRDALCTNGAQRSRLDDRDLKRKHRRNQKIVPNMSSKSGGPVTVATDWKYSHPDPTL